MITNIFFDFDGVLAESVQVKSDAFYKLYQPYGKDIAEKVIRHHINNGGISRFEKFKFYHEEYLNIKIDDSTMQELTKKFGHLVLDGVINSPEVYGVTDFLEKNKETYDFFVITGTPTDEIKTILEKRDMSHYFIEALGSPTTKAEWTEHIITKYQLERKSIVFVGDALADYDAAQVSKIDFILRETEENIPLFEFFRGPRIKNFKNLAETIKKIIK